MSKRNKVIAFIVIILILGFVRESFFVNLNAQINAASNPSSNFNLVGWTSFLSGFSVSNLVMIKWIATFGFALSFLGLSILLINSWFRKSEYKYLPYWIFGGVFFLSGIATALGKIIPAISSNTYYFSRWLMGAAQSPLLPALICILLYYSEKQKTKPN